jgi:6-phosphogluconolactonase
MSTKTDQKMFVYVATDTHDKQASIYIYRLNASSGALEFVGIAGGVESPFFLAFHPQGRFLYTINATQQPDGAFVGMASAFAIDPDTGMLSLLNEQRVPGAFPCYITVDRTGQCALVANYVSGCIVALPILPDGTLGPASDHIQHQGSSIDPQRQEGPHAHCIVIDPTERYAFAADLGLDKILCYRLDVQRAKLTPNDVPWAQVKPGSGPRHLAFHPSGRFAYVINELNSTMVAFAYDASRGVLTELQTIRTIPEDFTETNYCADVHVSPSGKFLYGSNRGHDSIVTFRIAEDTGRLTYLGCEPSQGKWPRNFALDPSGNYLLAANQNSDNLVVFRIDPETGQPLATGHVVQVPKPVCVKVLPVSTP